MEKIVAALNLKQLISDSIIKLFCVSEYEVSSPENLKVPKCLLLAHNI